MLSFRKYFQPDHCGGGSGNGPGAQPRRGAAAASTPVSSSAQPVVDSHKEASATTPNPPPTPPVVLAADRAERPHRRQRPARQRVLPQVVVRRDGEYLVRTGGAGRQDGAGRRQVLPVRAAEGRVVLPQRGVTQHPVD